MPTSVKKVTSLSFRTRPTILQVIPAHKRGGVEIEAHIIAKAIQRAGGRALIAAQLQDDSLRKTVDGIEYINLPLATKNPLQMIKNTRLLKKLIIGEKIDLIHARSRGPAWSAYRAAHALHKPFMTTYHAAYGSKSSLKNLYNSVMARGEVVIAISHFIQNHIHSKYKSASWFDSSKVKLIHRGVDFRQFDPHSVSQKQIEDLKKKWDIPLEKPVILLPGRISKTKGHVHLLEALASMKNEDAIGVFIGLSDGHEARSVELTDKAKKMGLADRIRMIPPLEDVAPAYAIADVVVCPSLKPEGFGRVMVEAQAMGKPIVAYNHGAAPEILTGPIEEWLIPAGDTKALAETLDNILDASPAALQETVQQARENAQDHFSEDLMCAKTIAIYKELLNL